MTSAKVTAAGVVYPREPLTMDFTGSQFIRPYVQLFESLGNSKEDTGNYISLTDFKHSHCLLVFDLSPDEQDSMHWQLVREGTTAVEIQFGANIPAGGIEMICYAEFDNMITIDRTRNVFFDFSL